MKTYKQQTIDSAKTRLENVKPSHQDVHRIREGWQMDMWEKEITPHDGYGPSIKVFGRTAEEAEAMALIVCRKLSKGLDTIHGGTYHDGIIHSTEVVYDKP